MKFKIEWKKIFKGKGKITKIIYPVQSLGISPSFSKPWSFQSIQLDEKETTTQTDT